MERSKDKVLLEKVKEALSKATTAIFVCKRSVNVELDRIAVHEKRMERLQKREEKVRLVQKILRRHKAGCTYVSIARELNLPRTTVSRMCRVAKHQASVNA